MAARVVAAGASGQPEIDGALFNWPMYRDELVTIARSVLEEEGDAGLLQIPPGLASLWVQALNRPLPRIHTTDGDDLVPSHVTFATTDPERVVAALDGHPDLERTEGRGGRKK